VRECTKLLSQEENVFVIDTSNEIAGHGNIPHACIGSARRMMVESLEAQSGTMIECVQNHTPSIMVIDEIGRKNEAEAAQTSKNRGVRMIASAHGDMRSLLKNKDIRGLIGGIETVTLGDEEARALQKKKGLKELRKQVTARAGPPVFDIIIELHRGKLHEWNIIMNSAQAVDDILLGDKYNVQKRVRCANTGRIFVEKVKH
jgi:stage III sporulation protein SpoIIIAA